MAKFVKLENGNYVNVDMIIDIERQQILEERFVLYLNDANSREDDFSQYVTEKDIENILKASEENEK